MIDILLYVLIAITALSLVTGIILIILTCRKKTESNSTGFSESQEDFIIDRISESDGMLKTYLRDENGRVLDALSRTSETLTKTVFEGQKVSMEALKGGTDSLNISLKQSFDSLENKTMEQLGLMRREISESIGALRRENTEQFKQNAETLDKRLESIQREVGESLSKLRADNETKLNEMRQTVDEKLQQTLDSRIAESFKIINSQLEAVHKGLGEMQNLTNGVSSLNRVLNNVKTRGVWGEVSLENLLEQILIPEQYSSQYPIKGNEKVDFAVMMPGKDKERVVLPIDAKFPLFDYESLVEASDIGDKAQEIKAKKDLVARIKQEAKSISTKYIEVPKTTDFAIMYLPVEGLFAEVVREPGLADELQSKYKIVVCGPTTISALLNSLQIGFRTMAIQEQSAEVWKTLQKFKTEFTRFANDLDKVQKKATDVVDTIDSSVKRSRRIEKVLDKLGTSAALAAPYEVEENEE